MPIVTVPTGNDYSAMTAGLINAAWDQANAKVASFEAKLANEKFVSKAPPAILEQQRARRALRLELLAAGSDETVPVNEGLPQEPEPPVAQGL